MKLAIEVIVLLSCLFITSQSVIAAQADWSDWNRLEDRGLNGIYFSHKKECSAGSSDNCTLRWRWRNRYEGDMEIDYQISYKAVNGVREKTGRVKLQSGVNESPDFTAIGKRFDGVSVGIIASEEAKETAQRQAERERQAKAERKMRDEEEARQRQLAAEEASRRAEEQRQREQYAQEDKDRREEQERQEKRARQQQQYDEKRADDARFNAMVLGSMQSVANSIVQGSQTIENAKIQRYALERQQAEQQRQRERDEQQRQREAERRQERERQEQVRVAEEQRLKAEQQRQAALERRQAESAAATAAAEAEKERKRKESAGRWAEASYTVTPWGCDKLVLDSYLYANVADKADNMAFYGQYLSITNNSDKYSANYSLTGVYGTVGPGEKKLVYIPYNNGPKRDKTTEYQVNFRYFVKE